MRWLIGFVAILLGLFLFAYFQIDGGVMLPGQTVLESALQWVIHTAGSTIAVVAAFVLLLRALQNESAATSIPLTVPLLAGLVVANPHWSITLALATIIACLILKEEFAGRAPREPPDLT